MLDRLDALELARDTRGQNDQSPTMVNPRTTKPHVENEVNSIAKQLNGVVAWQQKHGREMSTSLARYVPEPSKNFHRIETWIVFVWT